MSLGENAEGRDDQRQQSRGDPAGCGVKFVDSVSHVVYLLCVVFLTNGSGYTFIVPAFYVYVTC